MRSLPAAISSSSERDGDAVVRYHDQVFPIAPGTDAGSLADVLSRQHYLLADWRDKADVLGYRRFFDVDRLIAIRVELPEVFDATHAVLIDLHRRGVHRRVPDRSPGRPQRSRGLSRTAAEGDGRRLGRRGKDPAGRRTPACLLGYCRHDRI
ncbi:MAG: hypothetical protein WKF82_07095 [Nocardioidaceae bacterium]